MAKRILLSGVLGGLVLFAWGAFSHMVLPLGQVGIKEIANEGPVLAAMRDAIREPGFYLFPGMGQTPNMSAEQKQAAMKAWEQKYLAGPWGILIYHPRGSLPMSPRQLLTELGANVLAVLIAAFLVSRALGGLPGFFARVLFVALLGLLATVAKDISYWNWYGFPGYYTLAALADEVVGFGLAGLVLAAVVKAPEAQARA